MTGKASRVIILALLLAPIIKAQEATEACSDGQTITIASQWDEMGLTMPTSEVAAQPLRYSISSPQNVKAAWVEVWDRPKRLSRKSVPAVSDGKASCAGCSDADETPSELHLSIFDPGVPLICIDYCPKGTPASGGYVSEMMVGKQPVEDGDWSTDPAYLMNYPALTGNRFASSRGRGAQALFCRVRI